MSVHNEMRVYKDGEQQLNGYLAMPKNVDGKLPAVIIFHALFGRTDHEEKTARRLAELGFVAFAADVYGTTYETRDEAFAELGKFRAARSTLLRGRLLAALKYVEQLPAVDTTKINAIGFCFGGMSSIDLARANANIRCAASFHGAYTPIDDETEFASLAPIASKLLVLHGDLDEHVNPTVDAFLEELRVRRADFQFVRYANAKHGFSFEHPALKDIPGVAYDETTWNRSWRLMLISFNALYGLPKLSDIGNAP